MNKFELTRSLGLKIWKDAVGKGFNADMVKVEDLERLLEAAQVVYGSSMKVSPTETCDNTYAKDWPNKGVYNWSADRRTIDKYTARLIGIQPIAKPDSLEQFAKDFIACDDKGSSPTHIVVPYELYDRARKLLGEQK